jgi:predicted dehydrogenase
MRNIKKEIGLAVIGCGTIGRIRAILARDYPAVSWLGLCDLKEDLGKKLAEDAQADFFTTDYKELLKRPEVNAAIISTDENFHTGPTLAAIEQGHDLLIEKPLATDVKESSAVLKAIQDSGVDAVIGYTNRFRRRFLAIKERLTTGQIGDVTAVVTRALMNKMVPIATVRRTDQRETLTPMVVSGTHSLAIFSMNISWALPVVWPGAVYGLEIGIVGTKGVIDVEDTHRDLVLASEFPQGAGYKPEGYEPGFNRHVDFLTSYPPGDLCQGQLWGPMREETNSWYARVCTGMDTPHATAADGHRNLVLTMAMDLSAKRGEALKLPVDLDEFYGR